MKRIDYRTDLQLARSNRVWRRRRGGLESIVFHLCRPHTHPSPFLCFRFPSCSVGYLLQRAWQSMGTQSPAAVRPRSSPLLLSSPMSPQVAARDD